MSTPIDAYDPTGVLGVLWDGADTLWANAQAKLSDSDVAALNADLARQMQQAGGNAAQVAAAIAEQNSFINTAKPKSTQTTVVVVVVVVLLVVVFIKEFL